MNFVVFDRQVRAQAEIDKIKMVLLQDVHHSIDHIKVLALGIVDGVVVNHSIVIDRGVGLRSLFAVHE